ncbi:MAG TPA: hypothetical protein VKD72_00240 [Gemmataceae bacterium]|nr:hypothetical protein [Gemmataceae bacterium]
MEKARQAEWSDISGSLAELQRSVEPRCLTDLLNEVSRLFTRRDWTSAQKLIAERLARLPSLGSVQGPLGQVLQATRQADRLDRLTVALNSSETKALEAWQRVPLHRLPPNLKSRATGLRGLLAVEAESSASWVMPPDVDELKRDLIGRLSSPRANRPPPPTPTPRRRAPRRGVAFPHSTPSRRPLRVARCCAGWCPGSPCLCSPRRCSLWKCRSLTWDGTWRWALAWRWRWTGGSRSAAVGTSVSGDWSSGSVSPE